MSQFSFSSNFLSETVPEPSTWFSQRSSNLQQQQQQPILQPKLNKPTTNNPFEICTWFLETKRHGTCSITHPFMTVEISRIDFYPFPKLNLTKPFERKRLSASNAKHSKIDVKDTRNESSRSYSFVSLQIIKLSDQQGPLGYERRLSLIQHVLNEMLRLKGFQGLYVFRLNTELGASLDQVYAKISSEIRKTKAVYEDTNSRSLQIST